jgi:hypothetical protein
MKSGDVLVSRPTARADVYDITVVPGLGRVSKVCYEDGMETARQLARELAVDGWFTCDHTYVVPIANTERRTSCLCGRRVFGAHPLKGHHTLEDKLADPLTATPSRNAYAEDAYQECWARCDR